MSQTVRFFVTIASLPVLAFAVPGLSAYAAEGCSISQGLSQDVEKFIEESEVCLKGAPDMQVRDSVASELARLTDVARTGAGRSQLTELTSLREAAQIHAMDMAARGYAAHYDPEGRSHVDRVRLLDRTSLFGDFGANVTIVPARATAKEIELALLADKSNAENVLRRDFNRVGVGAVEKDGKLYVVQLFAEQVGELSAPLPARVTASQVVQVRLENPSMERVRWAVVAPNGSEMATGRSARLTGLSGHDDRGFYTIDVKSQGGVSTLKGPAMMVE
ncbi:MAG TPA: CAP domain-containing protein [Hyphomonas sp.]|nr:CAP domain-containing protein [Hyphomonas sp.]MCA8904171.1 CAP domain-containing protein [Hyphomonas sp.]HPE48268.1 CAP domain-containing protein [Hyphomonas sp.]